MEVSVIIVSYNAEKFIGGCIKSVKSSFAKASADKGEIIVVDNGSTDGSGEIVKRMGLPQSLTLLRNDTNMGSAKARNQGARKAKGKYLIFFDCDTEIDKNCISEYVATFEKYPKIGACHGKLLKMDDRKTLDSSGELFDSFGFLADRGEVDTFAPIASGKAASYAIRADLFKKIGGYDKDFFFFVEEPDLDMRVWMSGYKVFFNPKAIVYHAFGTKFKDVKTYYSKYLVRYFGPRNYLMMHLKNTAFKRLIKIMPLMTLSLLMLAMLFIITGRVRDGIYIIRGILSNLTNWTDLMKKRKRIQKMKRIEDKELDFLYLPRRPVGVYLDKIRSYLKN